MDEKELNKAYMKIIRARGKSGARWQKTKEVSVKPSGESSPYQDFNAKSGRWGDNEPALAIGRDTPVGFSPATQMRNEEIAAEVKNRVGMLLGLAKQILTEQQYKVFILLAVKEPHLKERDVAKVLSISHGRVNQLWKAARRKLEKAYVERTH